MASVHVTLCSVSGRALTGASLPVPDSSLIDSETLALGASNIVSTITAGRGSLWSLAVRGGDAWVTFAPSPDASAGDRRLLPPGVWDFYAVNDGERVAVKAAD